MKELYVAIPGQLPKKLHVDGVDIANTYAINNIQELENRQSYYSNTIAVPKTAHNRAVLGISHDINSLSSVPYTSLECVVTDNGLPVFEGTAELVDVDEDFHLLLHGGNYDFFKEIEGVSIRDLDLARFNHPWTHQSVIESAGNTFEDGYTYPAINYGKLLNRTLGAGATYDELYPAVYVKTLLLQAFKEAGYTLAGDYQHLNLLERMVIPIDQPFSYGDEFTKAHSFRAANLSGYSESNSTDGAGSLDDTIVLPYNNDSTYPFFDGSSNNYNTSTYAYTAPTYLYGDISANLHFEGNAGALVGGGMGHIYILKNGVRIKEANVSFRQSASEWTKYNVQINYAGLYLVPGDVITIEARFRKVPELGPFKYRFTMDNKSTFSINVLPIFPPGAIIDLSQWLPDISVADLLLTIGNQAGLLFKADQQRRTVTVEPFKILLDNLDEAKNWTGKVDLTNKPRLEFMWLEYGYLSHLQYAADDSDSLLAKDPTYGRGTLLVPNGNLDREKTVFESVFAPTKSESAFFGALVLPHIPIFKAEPDKRYSPWSIDETYNNTPVQDYVSHKGRFFRALTTGIQGDKPPLAEDGGLNFGEWAEGSYVEFLERSVFSTSSVTPRILVMDPANTDPLPVLIPSTDPAEADAYTDFVNNCSFASLEFGSLIDQFYQPLQQILKRVKVLTIDLRLNAVDIATLDFFRPVYLDQFRSFFYINEVTQYKPGARESTEVQLIQLQSGNAVDCDYVLSELTGESILLEDGSGFIEIKCQ